MVEAPHPGDYMTDAQYEQFMRDGGISAVSIDVDFLNESWSVEEELLVEECSGQAGDHSDAATEALADDYDCEGGEWVCVVDGEVQSVGHMHPFRTHVQLHR